MSLIEQTVGRTALTLPGATRVFRDHNINFCCGGRISLREAAERVGLSPQALAAELEALPAGERDTCPNGLADLLTLLYQEMESHMQKEEQILFPMLRRSMGAQAQGPIAVMRHEHDDHGEHLEQLVALTDDITPPKGACTTWRALYTGLREFRDDLMQHIHLENNLLFERAG
ncbi:DUF542 domain-containing protein [Halomonas sp.]|uniref:DUF542 domain-containing protein n=1 Tax=Halomonas sp. TaxID=1486246 RepID=UPI00356758F4